MIICYAQKENLRGWVDEVRRISPKLPIIAVFIAKNIRRPLMPNQAEEFYGKIANFGTSQLFFKSKQCESLHIYGICILFKVE